MSGEDADMAALLALLPKIREKVCNGELDETLRVMEQRKRKLNWERLPEKVILLRHGESEGNVDRTVYSVKGDSQLEITPKGLQQAMEAGKRLRDVVGGGKIFVAVSPFTRAVQTLYGIYKGGFPRHQVGVVHHDARIREQEFGNFQTIGLTAAVREEEKTVGRFYYRRPNAESSADVFDRVCAFWDALLSNGPTSLLFGRRDKYDSCLLVTHGLTIRLLLMSVFQWSIETFETVFNLGNCEHITMRKNLEKCCYELCKDDSYPARIPWASRKMWVRFNPDPEEYRPILQKIHDLQAFRASAEGIDLHEVDKTIDDLKMQYHFKCAKSYTVLNYLSIKPPRSMQIQQVLAMSIPGHNTRGTPEELLRLIEKTPRPDPSCVNFIDWWGDRGSFCNKMLHVEMDRPRHCSRDLDVSPGGRGNLLPSGASVTY